MSPNSVCNYTGDQQIGLPPRDRLILYITCAIIYRPNWTPLSPITIINCHGKLKFVTFFLKRTIKLTCFALDAHQSLGADLA